MTAKWRLTITLPDGEQITPTEEPLLYPFLDTVASMEMLQKQLSKADKLPFQKVVSTVPVEFQNLQGKRWLVVPQRLVTAQEQV